MITREEYKKACAICDQWDKEREQRRTQEVKRIMDEIIESLRDIIYIPERSSEIIVDVRRELGERVSVSIVFQPPQI
mgnify:CR=1 FL=1